MSERSSEWPTSYIWILGCSGLVWDGEKDCGTKEIRYEVKEKTLHAAISRPSTEVEEMNILAWTWVFVVSVLFSQKT